MNSGNVISLQVPEFRQALYPLLNSLREQGRAGHPANPANVRLKPDPQIHQELAS